MKKSNVQKLEIMMANYLQYCYNHYLMYKDSWEKEHGDQESPAWSIYEGAYLMVEACGGTWQRSYFGEPHSQDDRNNINMYSHSVVLPNDDACERLNLDAWKV